jgi:hypothetical protein
MAMTVQIDSIALTNGLVTCLINPSFDHHDKFLTSAILESDHPFCHDCIYAALTTD